MQYIESVQVRAQFEALLLRPVFQPVTQALGEYGDIAAAVFAKAVANALQR